MGKKKRCFAKIDYRCLTQNCPYMPDCVMTWSRARMALKIAGVIKKEPMLYRPKQVGQAAFGADR